METLIIGQWWGGHQSRACKGLRFFFFEKKKKFCVLPWKDEREPTIKYCLWWKIELVQNFITIQSFGHKCWWADWIWVEYLPGFSTLQLCYKVQEFLSKMNVEPEDFTGRIIFMSMFNDISWVSKENKQECELSAQLVSIYAKRFSPGRWSFFGPGSEKKCYSTHESKTTRRMWDRVAELMMSTTKP